MTLDIFKRVSYLFLVFIFSSFNTGYAISPVLSSSLQNDLSSSYDTYEWSLQTKNLTSTISQTSDSNEVFTESLDSTSSQQFKSSPELSLITSASISPSAPSDTFRTTLASSQSFSNYLSNIGSYYPSESLSSTIVGDSRRDFGSLTTTVETENTLQTKEAPFFKSASDLSDVTRFENFHTPLISLLIASSSVSVPVYEETQSNFLPHTLFSPHSMTAFFNESTSTDVSNSPEHKKLLMLVLRAEDCTKLSKVDFERMLEKLMAKFGFGDAIPEVSTAKCFSHLHINLTVGGKTPTLRFLPNMDDRSNVTVDVLNRTFRVVKLEKIDLKYEKSKFSNASSSIIATVAKHESIAYISVGVTFGLVLAICILMCCIKCCCLRKSQKRFDTVIKGSAHVRLRPEDYTLTPIPRPTSLYVDYYRGSATADIFSTTSAGSLASTTPTVDQGIIQPFDTSIVPLEDSTALQVDSSRDPSVESVPTQSDLKTFNMHSIAGKSLRNASTDSKEHLNPKQSSRKTGSKTSGVANPTFQRY